MTLRERIRDTLGGSETGEQTFTYRCRECETDFESTEVSTSRAQCPDCGATGTPEITSV